MNVDNNNGNNPSIENLKTRKKGVSKNHNESLDIFHKYFEHSKNIEKATSETTIKPLISYVSFTN